uniref:Uncharacterized protein n=1 Tax=Romanomermis culicivorax TaxID=13658 RepID=A0A915LBJ6_ROMCU
MNFSASPKRDSPRSTDSFQSEPLQQLLANEKTSTKINRRFSLKNVKQKWLPTFGGGAKRKQNFNKSLSAMMKNYSTISLEGETFSNVEMKLYNLECLLQCCRLLRRCLSGRSQVLRRRIGGEKSPVSVVNARSPKTVFSPSTGNHHCMDSWEIFD